MTIEVTSVSSKGQVVIPNKIRKRVGLVNGSKLIIVTDGHSVILKPIETPRYETFKALIKESEALAREKGLTKADVVKAIRSVRNENRR